MREQSVYPYGLGWGFCTIDPKLYNAYSNSDTRRFGTITAVKEEKLKFTKQANTREYTGYFLKKYSPEVDSALVSLAQKKGGAAGSNSFMYAILNIHWDGGWLENNPTYAKQEVVNKKQKALWIQIAGYFRDVDEHLLFAGTNEVHVQLDRPVQLVNIMRSDTDFMANSHNLIIIGKGAKAQLLVCDHTMPYPLVPTHRVFASAGKTE